MPQTGAWRIPAQYRYALDLDDAGFAWEFLRRNEAFAADLGEAASKNVVSDGPKPNEPLRQSTAAPELGALGPGAPGPRSRRRRSDPLARWGLHFRAGSAAQRA